MNKKITKTMTKKMKKSLMLKCTLASLLVSAPVFSANYGLMEEVLLMAQVSNLGFTRISMEDEKITDVFVYPEESAKVVLHSLGSVFVLPNSSSKHLYLTLIGEQGSTQDMRLKFANQQPLPIKLVRSLASKNIDQNIDQYSSAQKKINQINNNLTTKKGK
jgi:hypothetical protein